MGHVSFLLGAITQRNYVVFVDYVCRHVLFYYSLVLFCCFFGSWANRNTEYHDIQNLLSPITLSLFVIFYLIDSIYTPTINFFYLCISCYVRIVSPGLLCNSQCEIRESGTSSIVALVKAFNKFHFLWFWGLFIGPACYVNREKIYSIGIALSEIWKGPNRLRLFLCYLNKALVWFQNLAEEKLVELRAHNHLIMIKVLFAVLKFQMILCIPKNMTPESYFDLNKAKFESLTTKQQQQLSGFLKLNRSRTIGEIFLTNKDRILKWILYGLILLVLCIPLIFVFSGSL
jgi:hypothetical protein